MSQSLTAGAGVFAGDKSHISANLLAARKPQTLVLASPQSRAIIGALDTLVDIGVPAEKEVIL
jgi:hypothetical protein